MCSVAQSCPTLCDPMDSSPLGSSVHRIFQARLQEWVATSCSVSMCVHAKSLQSCPTLCDTMDCSLTGSVHRILQARILGWVAMPSSRYLPEPGIEPTSPAAPALRAGSLPLSHQGSQNLKKKERNLAKSKQFLAP